MRPPRYDEDAVQSAESPYPAYAALRAAAPLCRGGPGQWVFTRHADIAALLRDPRLGSAFLSRITGSRSVTAPRRASSTASSSIAIRRRTPACAACSPRPWVRR